jgi:hypothetical protein
MLGLSLQIVVFKLVNIYIDGRFRYIDSDYNLTTNTWSLSPKKVGYPGSEFDKIGLFFG